MTRVNSYYGSYYTAFPTLAKSYATADPSLLLKENCTKNKAGQTCWQGVVKIVNGNVPQYDSVCVNNQPNANLCAIARTAFCKKHNCGGNQIDGKGSGPTAVHAGANDPLVKASDTFDKGAVDAAKTILGGNTAPSVNPASNCGNCTNTSNWYSFLDPSAWGCKFGKLGCEWSDAASKGWGGVSDWFGQNALWITGGGIVAIVILIALIKR